MTLGQKLHHKWWKIRGVFWISAERMLGLPLAGATAWGIETERYIVELRARHADAASQCIALGVDIHDECPDRRRWWV